MGMFSGIGSAQGKGGKGDYMPPGFEGDVELIKCEAIDVRGKGKAFTLKYKVLSSTGTAPVAVGQSKDWFQNMWNADVAWPELLRFFYAVAGVDNETGDKTIKDKAEAALEAFVSDKNPLATRKLHLKTFTKKTKERGVDFTVHQWTPAAAA